jgi:hypothetical protein
MRFTFCVLLGAMISIIIPGASAQSTRTQDDQSDPSSYPFGAMNIGLGSLPFLTPGQTRSISAENPTGSKGMATTQPSLPSDPFHFSSEEAAGWKKHPFLAPKSHQTVTLMDVDGPGIIQHIWMVPADAGFLYHGRGCIVRIYWDAETYPSVEAPLTDFFVVGHDTFAPVNSLPVVDNPSSALNSFWPMPFRKHAKITVSNDSDRDEGVLAFQITYTLGPVPSNAAYFHAQYRQGSWATQNPYVILDGVKGRGEYVGTVFEVSQTDDVWFGEGEVQMFIDGDANFPTISGTGTEDYFLFSYGFPQVRSTLYSGLTLKEGVKPEDVGGTRGAKWTMYRWHIMDPIKFQKDFRITIEGLGGLKDQTVRGFVKRRDLLSSVAYWYQMEPHAPFPPLPSYAERILDPFGDFPVSSFDLVKARVTDAAEAFTWQPCKGLNTDFRKLYSGYKSPEGAFVSYGATVGVNNEGAARQYRGILIHPDKPHESLSIDWSGPQPAGRKLHLRYELIPASNAITHFSLTAVYENGGTGVLMDKTLKSPGFLQDTTLTLPTGIEGLRFTALETDDDNSSTVWFYPEIE